MGHRNSYVIISLSLILLSFFVVCKSQSTPHKEYLFVTYMKLNWQKAVEYCRSKGMFLVSIHNQDEMDAVKKEIGKSDYFGRSFSLHMWTSLNDLDKEGQYYWGSSGERNTLGAWGNGEPNNFQYRNVCRDEDCGVLVHSPFQLIFYALDDRLCTNEYVFMCEKVVE